MGVAIGGNHLKNTVVNGKDGNVKRAAAEVEDKNVFFALLVQAVRDSCGSWFVDNASHIQSGNCASIFRGLALSVIEVGCK